jgi:class 3 adenylate cyclase/pimeloyl-ACP methyl ester carboxylesterase
LHSSSRRAHLSQTPAVRDTPETQYVKSSDGVHIAYHVVGSGPVDLVYIRTWGSHLELEWDWPPLARFLHRLASFSRLIRMDLRGTGLSDPAASEHTPTLEDHAKDLRAVLDAAGSERAALVANNLGGLVAICFAASYPERTSHLVLDGCYARFARAEDYPAGVPTDVLERFIAFMAEPSRDSLRASVDLMAPTMRHDPDFAEGFGRVGRFTSSPTAAVVAARMGVFSDVRPLLGEIRAPTLVLYRAGDRYVGAGHARYLADHIAGAKLVELPGDDNLPYTGDIDPVIGEIQEFLTGTRDHPEFDRLLATVLFTDIVRSTDRVAADGDHRWRDVLDRHDELAGRLIEQFRGRLVKSTGDGVVATFDAPARAIRCAQAITGGTAALGLEVRSGIHTGEIELRGNDLLGLSVHVAQRVCSLAAANEVLASRTVVDLVAGSGIEFADRGEHELKGVPGPWRLFSVTG